MGIADDDVEKVRATANLADIVGEVVALRRSGTRWVGLCPFHTEKTPSFNVNSELGFYRCWGCGAKGDAITFLRETRHLDFVGAVEELARRAGVTLRYDSVRETGARRRRSVLVDAVGAAVEWYHQRLLTAPDAGAARSYLRNRGYDGEVVRRYRLGWAPEGWDELARSLGAPPDVLDEVGLAYTNRAGRLQDRFRARVLFPIFDARGDPLAFGGRLLPGAEGPKYLNSNATALYDKSEVLYGLNWAKADVVAADEVVVCEGYTDVLGLAAAGVPRAVATCGTALTERHVTTLRGFAKRVVLAFDADAAGQGAAARFYEWERSLGLEVAVAALPEGADPGGLAQSDPDALRGAVQAAVPFLAFRLRRTFADADLTTAEGRARTAEAALGAIGEHPSELVRDQYLMEVADRCRLAPDRLRSVLAGGGPLRPPSPDGRLGRRGRAGDDPTELRSPSPPRPTGGPGTSALWFAVNRPEAVVGLLDEVLFVDDAQRRAFRALCEASTFMEAVEGADADAAELLERAAVDDDADADAEDVAALLGLEAATAAVAELDRALRSSEDLVGLNDTMRWLLARSRELRDPEVRSAALGQLVAFFASRGPEAEEGE